MNQHDGWKPKVVTGYEEYQQDHTLPSPPECSISSLSACSGKALHIAGRRLADKNQYEVAIVIYKAALEKFYSDISQASFTLICIEELRQLLRFTKDYASDKIYSDYYQRFCDICYRMMGNEFREVLDGVADVRSEYLYSDAGKDDAAEMVKMALGYSGFSLTEAEEFAAKLLELINVRKEKIQSENRRRELAALREWSAANESALDYVALELGDLLARGLTLADIMSVQPRLYKALYRLKRTNALPDDLEILTKEELTNKKAISAGIDINSDSLRDIPLDLPGRRVAKTVVERNRRKARTPSP